MADLAKRIDAIPLVASTSERNALFATPAVDTRIQNKETGAVERWNGSAWTVDGQQFGGTNATRSVDPVVVVGRTVDDTTSGNGHCFTDSSVIDRSGGIAYNSFDCRILVQGTQSYNHFAAHQAGPSIGTAGTVTNLYGFVTIHEVTAGTITNNYGLYHFEATGAGAITNNYGIYVESLTKGGTSNYAIYTNLGLVRFGDVTTAEKNSNASFVAFRAKNTSNGAAATAQVSLQNDQAANAGGVTITSSGYTPSGLLVADGVYFFSQRPGGIVINAEHASGTVSIGANNTKVGRFDKPGTATQTGLSIWDVDNATLERVTVGAADSGGSGFKVLRIPN